VTAGGLCISYRPTTFVCILVGLCNCLFVLLGSFVCFMCFVAIKTGQKSKCIFERFAYSYSVLFSANFRLLFSSVLRAIRKSCYLYAIRVAVLSYRSWRNLQYNTVYSLQCTVTNRWFTRNIRFVNDRQNRRKSCPQPGGEGFDGFDFDRFPLSRNLDRPWWQ